MRLVHIQPVYAELLKGNDIILAILGAQLFQLELQLLSGFLQLLDGKALAIVALFAAFLPSQNNHKSDQIVFMILRAACIPC